MYGIDVLVEEHKNIYALTEYLEKVCCDILDGAELDVNEFRECVDFIRNYADKHHHAKEELILFRYMLDKKDPVAEKLVRNGMLVEHDLARYHVSVLDKALSEYEASRSTKAKLLILANTACYVDLLQRHIGKENEVCYTYGEKILSDETKKQVDEETKDFEDKASQEHIQEKYIAWIGARR